MRKTNKTISCGSLSGIHGHESFGGIPCNILCDFDQSAIRNVYMHSEYNVHYTLSHPPVYDEATKNINNEEYTRNRATPCPFHIPFFLYFILRRDREPNNNCNRKPSCCTNRSKWSDLSVGLATAEENELIGFADKFNRFICIVLYRPVDHFASVNIYLYKSYHPFSYIIVVIVTQTYKYGDPVHRHIFN